MSCWVLGWSAFNTLAVTLARQCSRPACHLSLCSTSKPPLACLLQSLHSSITSFLPWLYVQECSSVIGKFVHCFSYIFHLHCKNNIEDVLEALVKIHQWSISNQWHHQKVVIASMNWFEMSNLSHLCCNKWKFSGQWCKTVGHWWSKTLLIIVQKGIWTEDSSHYKLTTF